MLLWIPLWRVSSNKRKRFYSAHRKGIPHRCSINNSALIKTEHRSFLSSVHVVNLSTRSRAFNKITRSANPVQLRGRPHPTPRQSGATPSTRIHSDNHTAQKKGHNIASPHREHHTSNCCRHSLKMSRTLLHTPVHPKSNVSKYPGLLIPLKNVACDVPSRSAKHHAGAAYGCRPHLSRCAGHTHWLHVPSDRNVIRAHCVEAGRRVFAGRMYSDASMQAYLHGKEKSNALGASILHSSCE